jgi:hypothetical protein
MVTISTPGDDKGAASSAWVLLARDPSLFATPAIAQRAVTLQGYSTNIPLWTDDFSNLFQILN